MKPTRQIIPGFELPDEEIIVYAKDQPEYLALPAWNGPGGKRVMRWKLSWKERWQVFLGGSIWTTILTFNRALQPIKIETACPLMGSAMLDREV